MNGAEPVTGTAPVTAVGAVTGHVTAATRALLYPDRALGVRRAWDRSRTAGRQDT